MGSKLIRVSEHTIDDLFNKIESRKVKINRENFNDWLFEYSSRTCEYEGINPANSGGYLGYLMILKLYSVLEDADEIYWETNKNYLFFLFR